MKTNINITIDEELLDFIDEEAKKRSRSRSNMVNMVISLFQNKQKDKGTKNKKLKGKE